jgi:mono/diheme cytochrome c family protein
VSLVGFAQSGSSGKAASKSSVAEGKGIYDRRCASCHFSESTAQKIGPGLKGLYNRATFAGGGKVDDASVTKWIESGGTDMPGFKDALKAEQIRALVSYLKAL